MIKQGQRYLQVPATGNLVLVASVGIGWDGLGRRGMVDVTGGMQAAFAGCGLIGRGKGRYSEVFVSRGGPSTQLDGRRALGWGASPVGKVVVCGTHALGHCAGTGTVMHLRWFSVRGPLWPAQSSRSGPASGLGPVSGPFLQCTSADQSLSGD